MHRLFGLIAGVVVLAATIGSAPQPSSGPYRVLKTSKVGGEGGWDYIYADAAGRRLYIPRGGTPAVAASGTTAASEARPPRLTIFNLDTLEPLGEIEGVGGHGTVVDPKSGHGFVSGKPVSMFDTQKKTLIKTIDVGNASPDGILFDAFNERVYIFSHPTRNATVINAKDGSVVGTIDLGGVPEEGVADGQGKLWVVMQDMPGSVTEVDAKAMKATAHFPLGDKGRCNGLALDAKNQVLFAACANSGNPPADPPKPTMVILRADDGKILATEPLPGGSDGAVFNPDTMEAFATLGNGNLTVVKEKSPTSFEVEQNLETMSGARTITLDTKTGHIFTMSDVRGPAPAAPASGEGRGRGRGRRAPAIPGSFTILMIGR